MSGSQRQSSQPPTSIKVPVGSALARSLQSAEEHGESLAVDIGDMTYAVSVERSSVDEADRKAALAAAGRWKGLVDGEVLKKQLKDARGSKRSPATL